MLTTVLQYTMAAATRTMTPKRDNSHMSPPDKNIQTKMPVLSPKMKDMFAKSLRREILRQTDGYDTEDEVPLSQLRDKVKKKATQTRDSAGMAMIDSSIIISDDLDQAKGETEVETINDNNNNRGEGVSKGNTAEEHNQNGGQTPIEADPVDLDSAVDPLIGNEPRIPTETDPVNDVNKKQLIAESEDTEHKDPLLELIATVNIMSKKLDRLEIVEQDIKEIKASMLTRKEVEEIITEKLTSVKTAMMQHDLKINKNQREVENMNRRVEQCSTAVKEIEASVNEKIETSGAELKKDEVEKMIKLALERDAAKANEQAPTNVWGNRTSNKNLIIHGMEEDRLVDNVTKVQDVARDIGLALHRWDVDRTTRLGAFDKEKKRPVRVELVSETTKLDILRNKRKLKQSELYTDIQVVPDETKEVRHAKAILRQAAYLAKRNGDRVWKRHDLIWVNGTKYTVDNVEDIPDNLRFKRREGQGDEEKKAEKTGKESSAEKEEEIEEMDITAPQEITSDEFKNKNWDQAARASYAPPQDIDVEVKGASHLTKRGLAFFTGKSFLSNFYLVEFKFNGHVFYSAEQAYQFEKAHVCRDSDRMDKIHKAKTPKEAKDIGKEVKTTSLWHRLKDDRMKEILDAKFSQNQELRKKLMATWGLYLIEGSTDAYWGAGTRLYSKELLNGNWNGLNKLGEMLVELRNDMRRRGY